MFLARTCYNENGDGCTVCWMSHYMIEDDGYALIPRFWDKIFDLKIMYWNFRKRLVCYCDDPYCKKIESICGFAVGNHSKCEYIPF